ncbi:MAG TPA: mannose-1-phosphate guanylyltransferase/mannose-6-phosphate isomerase [Azospirillaceae bacterium]|nr:mannose-1-phosphate guanylyltransferase/mannose-6-phosphate isomerase [Azospirillaceae bacterium]
MNEAGGEKGPAAGAAGRDLIVPVILSGGTGTRLWPLSRTLYPKQFHAFAGSRSLFQETVLRFAGDGFAPPVVVCSEEHRFLVAEQLRLVDRGAMDILLEPAARNTAPAACVAALRLLDGGGSPLMLVVPSDHVIEDPGALAAAVALAAPASAAGRVVMFGVRPHAAETGYGYIRAGVPLAADAGILGVERFVEKPERSMAEAYLSEAAYLWNSGMFLVPAAAYVAELERFCPAMVEACRRALARAERDLTFVRLGAAFGESPAGSIDHTLMERTDRAAVVPVEMGWSDVGAWSTLWDLGSKDDDGNVLQGDAVVHKARNVYVRAEDHLVAVAGVSDVIVVETDDTILVSGRDNADDVQEVVKRLKAAGRQEHALHRTVHRPWGAYRGVDSGNRYQVKRIVVAPGQRLSLQMHHHRAEHWIVVEGTALVTRGDERTLLFEDQSIYIPMGTVHRLENPGKVPLHLIEVQSGSYLGEDDIVRIEDSYGRVAPPDAEGP